MKDIEQKLKKAIEEGPTFGQSIFQTKAFVLSSHELDARTYRQILIELNSKYIALKKCEIRRKKIEAEIRLLEKKILKQLDEDEKIILECDLEDKRLDLESEEKLIVDAAKEFNYLWAEFEKRPTITSEEFEKQEQKYWQNRLIKQAQLSIATSGGIDQGTSQALLDIGINPIQAFVELKRANDITMLQTQEKLNQLELKK